MIWTHNCIDCLKNELSGQELEKGPSFEKKVNANSCRSKSGGEPENPILVELDHGILESLESRAVTHALLPVFKTPGTGAAGAFHGLDDESFTEIHKCHHLLLVNNYNNSTRPAHGVNEKSALDCR